MSTHTSAHSSSAGSASGFPEEDLREGGRDNPFYFPVRLGQAFQDGRYCVVRKLGWGQYSSVWLARDKKLDRFAALKILTCESTKASLPGNEQRSDELRILEKIAAAQLMHRGFKHNLALYDSFEFSGPHGVHRCLVTEVLGFSLDHLRKLNDDGDYRLKAGFIKRVVKQILYGLEYLHDVCGVIHADIKHDNILFRPLDVSKVVAHELAVKPSVTYDSGTEVCPAVVPVVSQILPLSIDGPIEEERLEAVIADVGHSHWQDRHFQELIQPRALRAPEVILGYPWDASADIWSLGCLVTELLIGFWLFEANAESEWGIEEDHLARMVEALGTTFDPSFLTKCEHRDKFFTADGSFAHFTSHQEPTWRLEKLIDSFSLLDKDSEDSKAAARFLRRCLRLVPEERAKARELVEDPWLLDVM